ncbi:MAG: hypothetical protein LBU32_17495 [Clostridiales bacterium]|nr:hypothetical protein [Clostridiales bacterium]
MRSTRAQARQRKIAAGLAEKPLANGKDVPREGESEGSRKHPPDAKNMAVLRRTNLPSKAKSHPVKGASGRFWLTHGERCVPLPGEIWRKAAVSGAVDAGTGLRRNASCLNRGGTLL